VNNHIIRPDDVRRSVELAQEILAPAVDEDWAKNASGLSWSCQFTLDHIIVALTAYAGDLATRTVERHPVVRAGNPEQPVPELLALLPVAGGILADVCASTPEDVLGYHPDGPADWSGFAGMGCVETLIHADDICWALHLEFHPDADLCQRILQRMFPWAPTEGNPWQILRWATGRGYLEGSDPLGPNWEWHCKPLSEWTATTDGGRH
jgi:hypothetical protein